MNSNFTENEIDIFKRKLQTSANAIGQINAFDSKKIKIIVESNTSIVEGNIED